MGWDLINLFFSKDVYKDSFLFFSSFVLILLLFLDFALCRCQIDKKAKNVCGQATKQQNNSICYSSLQKLKCNTRNFCHLHIT